MTNGLIFTDTTQNIWCYLCHKNYWHQNLPNSHVNLTLQCCHHFQSQFHSLLPQFHQNQVPIHHLNVSFILAIVVREKSIQCCLKSNISSSSHRISRIWTQTEHCRKWRVLFLTQREVKVQRCFCLALFSTKPKVQLAEWGACPTGSLSTLVRNEGLILQYGMC